MTPVTGDTAVTEPDRSIGALLSDIMGDLPVIVRGEVRLAKAEIREEIAKARRGVVLLVAGGLVLAAALGCGLLAAIYGLSMVWPPWAAALAVGACSTVTTITSTRCRWITRFFVWGGGFRRSRKREHLTSQPPKDWAFLVGQCMESSSTGRALR